MKSVFVLVNSSLLHLHSCSSTFINVTLQCLRINNVISLLFEKKLSSNKGDKLLLSSQVPRQNRSFYTDVVQIHCLGTAPIPRKLSLMQLKETQDQVNVPQLAIQTCCRCCNICFAFMMNINIQYQVNNWVSLIFRIR